MLCYLYTIIWSRDMDTINRNGTENRKPGNIDIQENSENYLDGKDDKYQGKRKDQRTRRSGTKVLREYKKRKIVYCGHIICAGGLPPSVG